MGIKIYRSRKTRSAWRVETTAVVLRAGDTPARWEGDTTERALMIGFDVPVAGGGKSSLVVSISTDDFDVLAAAMTKLNPDATERAFVKARRKLVPTSAG